MEKCVHGGAFVISAYALTLLLHLVVPSRVVTGYCCNNSGTPLKYRLNGFLIYLIQIGLFFFILPKEFQVTLYDNYWGALAAVNILGLSISFWFFSGNQTEKYARCITVDQRAHIDKVALSTKNDSQLSVFFLGRNWNPRFLNGYFDVKMFLYIVGAIGLLLNILSCYAKEIQIQGTTSTGMQVYCGCFIWFLGEYMLGEEVHLYTYDLFAEKIGFKLAWGCTVFYPFFYCIGAYSIVNAAGTGVDIT